MKKIVLATPENYGISVLVDLARRLEVDTLTYSIFRFRKYSIGSFKPRFYLTWTLRKWKLKKLGFKLERLPLLTYEKVNINIEVLDQLREVYLQVCLDHFVFVNHRFPLSKELVESKKDREWIRFISSYHTLKEYLLKDEITDLYVFNGRPMILKLLEFICRELGVRFHILEILGGKADTLRYLSSSVSFWNFHQFSLEISRYYNSAITLKGKEIVDTIAKNYYYRRKKGDDVYLSKWINSTVNNSVRSNDKKICSFFFSSIDELPAFDKIEKEINYLDQISLVKKISEIITYEFVDYEFKLKLHPRMLTEKKLKYFLDDVLRAKPQNVEIVPFDLNPYALIESSDIVCASVSSVVWEATFFGKCSVIFGGTWANAHDVHHTIDTWEEFREVLKQPIAKNPTNALQVAYYIETAGHELNTFL